MKNKTENLGNSLYKQLQANNSTVKIIVGVCVLVVIVTLMFAFTIYKQSLNRTYIIDGTGNLVPVSLLPSKEAEDIQARANLDLFVNYYYNLEGATMRTQQEKLLWLIGEQPTSIVKDRIAQGYFADFLSYTELRQRAYILSNTLEISSTHPYIANFIVRIERQNKDNIDYYNNKVAVKLERVNKNYPYNPYGFLITQMNEELQKVTDKKTREAQDKEHIEFLKQIQNE